MGIVAWIPVALSACLLLGFCASPDGSGVAAGVPWRREGVPFVVWRGRRVHSRRYRTQQRTGESNEAPGREERENLAAKASSGMACCACETGGVEALHPQSSAS